MQFEISTAGRVIFGRGTFRTVLTEARAMGRRALLVAGRNLRSPQRQILEAGVLPVSVFQVEGEPTVEEVQEGVTFCRAENCDVIIGCGGGSVIDAAKAIAGLLTNEGDLLEYLEVIGKGQPLTAPAAPWIAVPTTAGAGAEVTRNAVLRATGHGFKVSLRSSNLLPRLAVVDPELTCELPPALTACTGMDALTQLIEPFVSCRANPWTDGICREGLRRVSRCLRVAYLNGGDDGAREGMALGSLFGGMALANAGLGAVHGFAAPIGGMFPAPHGGVCAALLPEVCEANVRALRQRQPESGVLGRYAELAGIITGRAGASIEEGLQWIRQMRSDLEIPGLGTYGIRDEDIPGIVVRAEKASSMQANPIVLNASELARILAGAIDDRKEPFSS